MQDAQPADYPPKWRRVQPRHWQIWIRLDGRWQEANLHKWFQDPDGRWLVWVTHRNRQGYAYPEWGLFVYDPESIRPRGDEYPAPE